MHIGTDINMNTKPAAARLLVMPAHNDIFFELMGIVQPLTNEITGTLGPQMLEMTEIVATANSHNYCRTFEKFLETDLYI